MANEQLRAHLRDVGLFISLPWGNELNANIAGTTATARGSDPAAFSRFAASAQPEPFLSPTPAQQPPGPSSPSIAGGASGGCAGCGPGSITWPNPADYLPNPGDYLPSIPGLPQIPSPSVGWTKHLAISLLAVVLVGVGAYAILK